MCICKFVYLLNIAVLIVSLIPEFAEQAASLSLEYQIDINPLISPVAEFLHCCSAISRSTYLM